MQIKKKLKCCISLQANGRNMVHTSTQMTTPGPAGTNARHTQRALLCTSEGNKRQSSMGRYRANHSVSMHTVANKHDVCGRMCTAEVS